MTNHTEIFFFLLKWRSWLRLYEFHLHISCIFETNMPIYHHWSWLHEETICNGTWMKNCREIKHAVVHSSFICRPSVIRRPSFIHPSTFSKQISSLSFYPIFPIFGLNVHNNIAPKPMLLFLMDFQFSKNMSKMGFLEVFGFFHKKRNIMSPSTWFTGISGVLSCVH